ncbi:hypothetical protein LNJ05_12725 [Tenacibaculum finnmarkense genomovar ulcerans]|uniref:hypothetical protein n=1 Tax=Tenacibaculum finnmarkense TaxID=2781243 RepID=UPI001E2D0C2C|nr:hypothetical protein [Tenacibaculum finnmarkense]MCD8433628.1 hypothetical protein [Tenacibaculum finnmarkense genomovar ulcerans]MCG8808925.1 hypothetical protein [Tenacibaculum finnmarkense]MCG8819163.1 hypothetical protein [Tenacibaculum finnmarkense]MCG8860072.1 hypothetical protein [Tenacibaculum finnmarkense]
MRTIITSIFLLLTLLLKAQENKNCLENKTLISKVGSLCEETNIASSCAGAEIYLVLMFKKEKVSISEKYISTCDKVTINNFGNYKWMLLNNKEVKINYNPSVEDIIVRNLGFSIFMKDLKFKLNKCKLIGEENRNNRVTKYTFIDGTEQK